MPALTNAKHERFAQELAKGKSASEAYVLAGYRANDGNASTLKGNQKVEARLAEIMGKAAERAIVTRETLINEAHEIQVKALKAGQYAAATGALTAKAKLAGEWVERSEVKSEVEVTDARERLARIVAGHTAAAGAGGGSSKPH